ncbi:hypothetical protein [Treponema sp.]|uniref:hypothetical protein n=1 Tax=Treponema sp. TaxID=166 RepID=UPI00298E5768|nr:hypothetical protein [Treponema sp.]MCQ2240973.1 hypothetical protein [Treponema sp.]
MNKKHYIFVAVFALFLSGIFSSCVIVHADGDELYDFRFVNNHILECNYSGYVDEDDIRSVRIYDNHGNLRYSSVLVSTSCKNSRVTFVLDRCLRNGWHVEIRFDDAFSVETYSVYYYD